MESEKNVERILARQQARELTQEEWKIVSGGSDSEERPDNGCRTISGRSCTFCADEDCGADD